MSPRYKSFDSLSQVSIYQLNSIGSKLKGLRLKREWSIQRLSELTGISISTIKQIEQGNPTVSFGFIVLLLQTYGMISELDGFIKFGDLYGSTKASQLNDVDFDDDLS